MVKVTISRGENKTSLHVKGHAGSGPINHDLVCSAVSAILFGGMNALANPKDYDIKISEGDVLLEGDLNSHDKDVIEVVITQLKTIEESYPSNIKIVEKGLD